MTHPLQLAPDYIPIDVREKDRPKNKVTIEKRTEKVSARDAAAILGLTPATFFANTKRNRAIRLIGKGDYIVGYERYEAILKETAEIFLELCEEIHPIYPKGFAIFDEYRGVSRGMTDSLRKDVLKVGIHQWKKLVKVHRAITDYRRCKAYNEGKR